MGLWESFGNIRYFFMAIAEFFRMWFMPFHYDEDEEGEAEKKKAAGSGQDEDAAPDRSPKPSPGTEETGGAGESATTAPGEPASTAPATAPSPFPRLSETMAFRGAITKEALAAVRQETPDQIDSSVGELVNSYLAEDIGDGRYVLTDHERREVIRSNKQAFDWLARLDNSSFEDDVHNLIAQLCRQLPVKITPGETLMFHLRQQRWMVWRSEPGLCRVRMFGTVKGEAWDKLKQMDHGIKRYLRKEPHGWDGRDWVNFRWRTGADVFALESLLAAAGQEFYKMVRRRRRGSKASAETPLEPSAAPPAESSPDSAGELPAESLAELPAEDYPQD